MVAKAASSQPLPGQAGLTFGTRLHREKEGVAIGETTDDGEDGVDTLEEDAVEKNFAQDRVQR